jgi:hypothetical protein
VHAVGRVGKFGYRVGSIIEPTRISDERGQRYRVHFQGAVLIQDCWNPELDACRALVVRGLAGWLEGWRVSATYPGLIIPDIGAAAFRTVNESEKMGPRFGPWTPHPEDHGSDAVSRSPVFAPAAVSRNPRETLPS